MEVVEFLERANWFNLKARGKWQLVNVFSFMSGKYRFVEEGDGRGARTPGLWDSQAGSLYCLQPTWKLTSHSEPRSIAKPIARLLSVLSRSSNHRQSRDLRAPPVLALDFQLLTHF